MCSIDLLFIMTKHVNDYYAFLIIKSDNNKSRDVRKKVSNKGNSDAKLTQEDIPTSHL